MVSKLASKMSVKPHDRSANTPQWRWKYQSTPASMPNCHERIESEKS